MINKTYLQQGDVLLKMRDKVPSDLTEIKTDLIHKGQNHHHKMRGEFKVYGDTSKMFIEVKDAELYHEEHKTIKVSSGVYEKDIVREYDHWLEESREVID